MSTPSSYRPDGYQSITLYAAYQNAAEAIAFYEKVFGAKERYRLAGYGGKGIGHAEIVIGDTIFMLSDEFPDYHARAVPHYGGTPVCFALYVEDCDAVFNKAVAEGCKVLNPMDDKFYGERSGTIEDPFGYRWMIMTHIEDVSPEEMERRWEQMQKDPSGKCD